MSVTWLELPRSKTGGSPADSAPYMSISVCTADECSKMSGVPFSGPERRPEWRIVVCWGAMPAVGFWSIQNRGLVKLAGSQQTTLSMRVPVSDSMWMMPPLGCSTEMLRNWLYREPTEVAARCQTYWALSALSLKTCSSCQMFWLMKTDGAIRFHAGMVLAPRLDCQ